MEWYWWIAILLAATLVVLGVQAFRATRRGRRFLGLSPWGKVRFGRLLLEDREVSPVAKLVLVVLVGYLALPLDIIPDFIPVVGQLDDAVVVMLAMSLLVIAVPRRRFEAALARAEAEQEERRTARARPAVDELQGTDGTGRTGV